MSGFTKLFSSIVTSTIWSEDDKTRIVWVTMLAISDRCGFVAASIPGLAKLASVSIEDCKAAIEKLSSPDTYSRTKEHEGRRIAERDGGWLILNYLKYREAERAAERTVYFREQKRKQRRAMSKMSTQSTKSTNVHQCQPIAEAEAEAEADSLERGAGRACASRPSEKEVLSYASVIGLAEWRALDWFREMEGCGWMDHNRREVVAWQRVMDRVKVKWEADGRPSGPPSSRQSNSKPRAAYPSEISKSIAAIDELILKSPANHDSAFYDSKCEQDEKQALKSLRARREMLVKQLAGV